MRVVEGVGGWLVPIRADYFVANLAAAMKLPVLVVAQNRLGCLNHTLLTLRNIEAAGARCSGVVLHSVKATDDIAAATNSDMLRRLIDAPMLPTVTEQLTELPLEWLRALDSNRE